MPKRFKIMEWIKIKDSKPDTDDMVLLRMAKFGKMNTVSGYYLGFYDCGKWEIETSDGHIKDAENNPDYWQVTHWMPLPEPPKE